MRNTFIGYYRPSDIDLKGLWENCTFVLDANVLLNLYRYSQDTTSELLKILHKIGDRIWVPHQAAFEYQKRRLEVISQQEQAYDEALNFSKKSSSEIKNRLLSSRHPFISDSAIITKKLDKLFSEIKKKLNESKAECTTKIEDDSTRNELTDLLDGKIGKPYESKKYKEILEIGKKRYEKKIPPGYEDQKNKDNGQEYGDLIFWFQTLDFAKETQGPIILITDEKKEDWWHKNKGKIIGPRPELVKEIKDYSDVSFYMYRVDPFMVHARKFLKQQIKSKAIDEVREIRHRDDEKIEAISSLSQFWEEYAHSNNLISPKSLANVGKEAATLQSMYSKSALQEMFKNAELMKDLVSPTYLANVAKEATALQSMYSKSALQEMVEQQKMFNKINKEQNKSTNKDDKDSSSDPSEE